MKLSKHLHFDAAAWSPSKRGAMVILLGLCGMWIFALGHKGGTLSSASSTSRYMSFASKSGSLASSKSLGCLGAESKGGVVVLAYGKQVMGGTGAFGGAGVQYPYEDLLNLTLAYGDGLKTCSVHPWTVIVTTSNYEFAANTPAETWGKEWADMVNSLTLKGDLRVRYVGGIDLEPGWGDPIPSMRWLESYREHSRTPLWSNASADGCPPKGKGNCANGWTTELMSKAVWDDKGVVVPQIYRMDGVQAEQWANLARIGMQAGRSPKFGAVMTQIRACGQVRAPDCRILKNTPQDALKQLNFSLKGTGLRVRHATDIGWR